MEENRKGNQRRNQTTRKFVSFPSSILFTFFPVFLFFFLKLFQLIGRAGNVGLFAPVPDTLSQPCPPASIGPG